MEKHNRIEHRGRVKEITGNKLKVSIMAEEACASCKVKGVCSVSSVKEKIVDVQITEQQFDTGEEVYVFYEQKLGFLALFLGYILPFLVVMAVLIVLLALTGNELIAGVAALLVLGPYYLALYWFRHKIDRRFRFSISKLSY